MLAQGWPSRHSFCDSEQHAQSERHVTMASDWSPESWTKFEARHLPAYEDADALAKAEAEPYRVPGR